MKVRTPLERTKMVKVTMLNDLKKYKIVQDYFTRRKKCDNIVFNKEKRRETDEKHYENEQNGKKDEKNK